MHTSVDPGTPSGDHPRHGRQPASADSPPHFQFVDSLRGMAILMVMTFHCCAESENVVGWVRAIALQGKFGVQLFFVVSAFTLFWSLQSRSGSERKPLHAFFVRRLFRIAPLFYLGAVFYGLQHWAGCAIYGPKDFGAFQFIATLLFVHGWFPSSVNTVVPGGWSIGAEFMFYLCLPLLFSRVRTLTAALWLTLISTAVVSFYSPIAVEMLSRPFSPSWNVHIENFVYWTFPSQFPVFCLGIVLYFLLRDRISAASLQVPPRSTAPSPSKPRSNRSAALLCIALAVFLLLGVLVPQHVLCAVAFVALAYGLALVPFGLVVNRLTRFIGKVSFSAYIWHFYVLDKILHPLPGAVFLHQLSTIANGTLRFALLAIAVTAVTLSAATITYYVIELPGQHLGRRLIFRMGWGAKRP